MIDGVQLCEHADGAYTVTVDGLEVTGEDAAMIRDAFDYYFEALGRVTVIRHERVARDDESGGTR